MTDGKKIKKLDFLTIFKLTTYFLRHRGDYALVFALIVPGLFILKAFITTYEASFMKKLVTRMVIEKDNVFNFSIAPSEMFIFMLFRIWYWNIDYASRVIFDFIISPIGGNLVECILHKLLLTENRGVYSISPGSCNYNLTEGTKALAKIIRFFFLGFIGSIIKVTSCFIIIYSNASTDHKQFTFLIMGFFIVVAIFKLIHLNKELYYAYEASYLNGEKEKLYAEAINYLPIVKSYREEVKISNKYQRSLDMWKNVYIKVDLLIFTNGVYSTMAFDTIIIIAMAIYVNDLAVTHNGHLNPTGIIGLVNTYHSVIFNIPKLLNVGIKLYQDLSDSVVLSQRLINYVNYVKEDMAKKTSIQSFNNDIVVQDLIYYAKDKLVFSGVNFTINKGDRIALLGRNGSGKSSIFKLLLGFNDFRGSVMIDGIDIRKINILQYRSLVTYVPQDTKLFDATIFYNLTFGNSKSYQQVIEECKKMKIHDAIMSFQHGYNTVIGDTGKRLNGGLRQKIFYTRAFLCDTEIYLFDEPNNNLDSFHSHFLYTYLEDPAYSHKTFFVITHEQAMADRFPKVFNFNNGRITESTKSFD